MSRVLITAFEPYPPWEANSSWLCLMELTRDLPRFDGLTTRRYPVDFAAVRSRLEKELQAGFDVVLHLGQAPGAGSLRLEQFALNVGGEPSQPAEAFAPLEMDGPAAYRSQLPLAQWAETLRAAGIPAVVSHHAGTYLCNATLYWTHYLAERMGLATKAAFIHLPLETSQTAAARTDYPSLPATMCAAGVRLLLESLL